MWTESEHTYTNYDVSEFFLVGEFSPFCKTNLEKEYFLIKQFVFLVTKNFIFQWPYIL